MSRHGDKRYYVCVFIGVCSMYRVDNNDHDFYAYPVEVRRGKMDKCEGCPFWFEDNDRQQPCCGARRGRYFEDIHDPCHLDREQQDNIRKAIAGEGRLWCFPADADYYEARSWRSIKDWMYENGYEGVALIWQDQGGE